MRITGNEKRKRGTAKIQGKSSKSKSRQPVKNQSLEAEDVRRAVYDGMQDLRVKKIVYH